MSNPNASNDNGIDQMERELEEKKRRKCMRKVEQEEEETWRRFEAVQERRQRLLVDEAADEAKQAKWVQEERLVGRV
jgi:uncharacterized protein (DUF3084 family)